MKKNEISFLEEEVKKLEIEQETNKAMQRKILEKLKEQGIDGIDKAKIVAEEMGKEINDLQTEIDALANELREMIDEYRRNK